MQHDTEIQQKVFFGAKSIIQEFSNITSPEELIGKEDLVKKLNDYILFLKIYKKYSAEIDLDEFVQIHGSKTESIENETLISELDSHEKYDAEEEVIFNNKLNQIDESEIHHPEIEQENLVLEEEALFNNELNEIDENETSEIEYYFEEKKSEDVELIKPMSESEPRENRNQPEIVENTATNTFFESENSESSRRKIVEIDKEEQQHSPSEIEALYNKHQEEKKFRLANIKGLKKNQTLFEDDPLQYAEEEQKPETGSLLKSNISTDFMEADKPKQDFKLDLNDRIAFSQKLFNGSQTEMNETVRKLNSLKTLDEAKELLSDMYYEKNWQNADEYAQRLWSLVENKFL